jgi:hypothetical protein
MKLNVPKLRSGATSSEYTVLTELADFFGGFYRDAAPTALDLVLRIAGKYVLSRIPGALPPANFRSPFKTFEFVSIRVIRIIVLFCVFGDHNSRSESSNLGHP